MSNPIHDPLTVSLSIRGYHASERRWNEQKASVSGDSNSHGGVSSKPEITGERRLGRTRGQLIGQANRAMIFRDTLLFSYCRSAARDIPQRAPCRVDATEHRFALEERLL